jgi:hypothetical protein
LTLANFFFLFCSLQKTQSDSQLEFTAFIGSCATGIYHCTKTKQCYKTCATWMVFQLLKNSLFVYFSTHRCRNRFCESQFRQKTFRTNFIHEICSKFHPKNWSKLLTIHILWTIMFDFKPF